MSDISFENELNSWITKDPLLLEKLPPKPEPVSPSDCCNSGCEPCILDIYQQELECWALGCLKQLDPAKFGHLTHSMTAADLHPTLKHEITLALNSYTSFELAEIIPQTEDTSIYRFRLPRDDSVLNLPIGNHVIVRGTNGAGAPITRQYTPVACEVGYFELLIKCYKIGKMSSYIRSLTPGTMVEMRGSVGLFVLQKNEYSDILMLSCGTGITPLIRIIQSVLDDENENTRIRLLYACSNKQDIYFRDKINDWRRHWNFTGCFYLSKAHDCSGLSYNEECKNHRIDCDSLCSEIKKLRNPSKSAIFVCGSKAFSKDMLSHVAKCGVVVRKLFRF